MNTARCPVRSCRSEGALRVDGNFGSTLAYRRDSEKEWQERPDFRKPALAINGAADCWNLREDDDDYYAPPAPGYDS